MKQIRVLMVVRLFYPWIGGTERQTHKLTRKLMDKGVTVEIATGWWFRGTPQREVIDGIPVFRNITLWEFFGIKGLRKFGGYLYILSLLWYLWHRRASYDIIHVHGLNYHTFTAVLAGHWFNRRTLCKLANSGQASDINRMRENRQLALSQYFLPTALRCDHFVALNKTVIEELTAAGVPEQKITQLANGVETGQISPKMCYDLHTPVRLIYVGRLHKQKGLDVLLEALHRLLKQLPDRHVCLQLVGDGPLKNELLDLVARLELTQYVEFVGKTNQVFKYLQEADIFVLPSRAEGVSNALLEAMVCGLPVVVSGIPGNADVIEHAQNGLLFKVDDPDSLTMSLNSLLDQSDLRERLGIAARKSANNHYSLDYVAGRYIELYQKLLSAPLER